jgi:hypothetical protein
MEKGEEKMKDQNLPMVNNNTDENELKELAARINAIHHNIEEHFKKSLQLAIEIGEDLTLIKAKIGHGKFGRFVEENLDFKDRTARNYMNLFRNKDQLISANVSDLSSAYKLLKNGGKNQESEDEEKFFLTIAVDISGKQIINNALETAMELLETDSKSRAWTYIAYEWFQKTSDIPTLLPLEQAINQIERTYQVRLACERCECITGVKALNIPTKKNPNS